MIVYCYGFEADAGSYSFEKWVPTRTQAKKQLTEACKGLRPGDPIWIDKVHLFDSLEPKRFALACLNQMGHATQVERVLQSTVKEHREEVPA